MLLKYLKLALSLFVAILVFLFSGRLALAKADDLIISDDGSVILVVTASNPVLAASTDQIEEAKKILEKIIVAPAHAQNTVEVSPKPTKDQKIEVTVKSAARANAPARQEKKKVDQIVAEGGDKRPIFSIKANKSNQVTIKQGNVEASTPLPLTIDTKSKTVSTKVGNEQVNIRVLPNDVVKKVQDSGLITTQPSNGTAPSTIPTATQVTLQAQNGEAVYNISGTRREKLLNLIDLSSPVSVGVSAQTGRTVHISQPLLFNVLDLFRR